MDEALSYALDVKPYGIERWPTALDHFWRTPDFREEVAWLGIFVSERLQAMAAKFGTGFKPKGRGMMQGLGGPSTDIGRHRRAERRRGLRRSLTNVPIVLSLASMQTTSLRIIIIGIIIDIIRYRMVG